MSTNKIKTYHYIDERLINHYYEQFSAPITYDKVAGISASISLTGPSLAGSHSMTQRELTIYERIEALVTMLDKRGMLGYDRFRGDKNDDEEKRSVFRLETCRARRIVVNDNNGNPVASLWVSRQGPKGWLSLLLLIENNRDKNPKAEFYSQFTHLAIILMSLSPSIMYLPPFAHAAYLYSEKKSRDFAEFTDAITEDLVADPVGFLISFGAQALPERSITCLYWVRLAFTMGFELDGCRVTVGYPLYITDAEKEKDMGLWKYYNNVGAIGYSEEEIAQYVENTRKDAIKHGLSLEEAARKAIEVRTRYRELSKELISRKPRLQRKE